jgi:MtrB/PioB family decaheme-associated outer membrane protein
MKTLRIATLVLTLGLPLAGFAQVDTSEWKCELCPFDEGYRADVGVGATYVSDDAYRFGNASGLDESGVYADLDGEGHYAGDSYQLDWHAEDLGLDSRVFEIDGGRQGRFGFHLGYSELPYRLFDTTETVFSPVALDALALPAGWVTASQTSGFTELDNSLQPVQIGSDRTRYTAGADVHAFSGLTLYADFRREERDGIDIVAGSSFTQASLLPRMIDFQTDIVDLGARYSNGPLMLSLAWYGSFFENGTDSLTWDNPFTAPPGAEQGRLAQEPDNDFQQLSLAGTYAADLLDTVVAFSAAVGQGEQDQALLPYTINPTLPADALPRDRLDGEVDTTNYALTVTSRPLPKARLRLAYRYDERDNTTSRALWSRVIADSFPSGDDELNTPYSFERTRLDVSGSYRLARFMRLSGGYERKVLDRDYQEVAEQTEDTGWIRATLRDGSWVEFIVEGGTARRDIDRYDETVATSFGQNPLLRKYNLAYRYREFGELGINLAPIERPFSLGFSFRFNDDSYTRSTLGLTDSDSKHYSADFNYTLSEETSLYLLAGLEEINAAQVGSASFSTPTWKAVHEDSFHHYGGGLSIRQIGESGRLTLDYVRTEGETAINMIENGTPGPFPDLESEMDSLRLRFSYQQSDRLDIDVSVRYERFATKDWAIEGVEPDTISSILALGEDTYDYDVWVLGVGFRYLIGPREISFPE